MMTRSILLSKLWSNINLSTAEFHAAIAYYYDNQVALDERRQAVIQWVEENAKTLDKFKAKLANRQSDQTLYE